MTFAERLAEELLSNWGRLEEESEQQAALYQNPEAGEHYFKSELIELIQKVMNELPF